VIILTHFCWHNVCRISIFCLTINRSLRSLWSSMEPHTCRCSSVRWWRAWIIELRCVCFRHYGFYDSGGYFRHIGYSVNFMEILRRKQVGIHRKKEHNADGLIMGTCWLLYHISHNKTEIQHESQRIACGEITHKCL